jgi:DNA replication protein DnaC
MKKIDPKTILDDDFEQAIADTIASLHQNPFIHEQWKRLQVSEEEIKTHLSSWVQWQLDEEEVKVCLQAHRCVKPQSHHMITLERNQAGYLQRVMKPCPMMQESLSVNARLVYADFPEAWKNSDLFFDIKQRDSRKNLYRYLSKILAGEPTGGLYLQGGHQTGKSFSLAVFAYKYALNNLGRIAFIDSTSWLDQCIGLRTSDDRAIVREIEKLSDVDIVIFDNFGQRDLDDYLRDQVVMPLLAKRLQKQKITMFTSVYGLDDIETMFTKFKNSAPRVKELRRLIEALTETIVLPPSLKL